MRRNSAGRSATARNTPAGEQDARDAEALYSILEQEVVPEFYARDAAGMPRHWIERVRRSMAELAPLYSSSRMARDYVEQYYLPGTAELRRRMANGDEAARANAALGSSIASALAGPSHRRGHRVP